MEGRDRRRRAAVAIERERKVSFRIRLGKKGSVGLVYLQTNVQCSVASF